MNRYLAQTPMLDFSNADIQHLVKSRRWMELDMFERLKAIYNFVRDEILFGYNVDDNCPDDLLREHHQEMSPVKAVLYRNIGRHLMNRNVKKIRKG